MNIADRIHRIQCIGTVNLDKVDLKRLRYFIAVAEAGSFSRAAERLRIAQPHLSRQIMRLEADLSHRLFVRRARHVELTDAGHVLKQETDFIIHKLDGLPQRMSEAGAGLTGSLCIGLTTAACLQSRVADVIETMAREEPELVLRFCVESRQDLIEAVLDRRVQACFAPPPAVLPVEIRLDHLATESLSLAVHKGHRLAGRDHVHLTELADDPFILCERSYAPEIYDGILNACLRAGFSPRVILHVPQPIYALLLASAGIAITAVAASMRAVYAEDLVLVPFSGDILKTSIALITRADEHIAGVKRLRRHAFAVATKMH